ncbi:MAG TPA: hypothetical protein VMT52_11910 [Planctomycetota bacterium]|nr:hypothetical protein [Planctomycetota bacterium]
MGADRDERGLIEALLGDGRPFLAFTGIILALSGGFALFLSATKHFLPHDIQYLGMSAEELCRINQCRVVHFMIHDRVSFGGALVAIGILYMWLAEFPLRRGEAWAWWTFLASGAFGFATFLAYLGYGYLDTWHGAGTLLLLPFFLVGLGRSFFSLRRPAHIRCLLTPSTPLSMRSRAGWGRLCLLGTAAGLIGAGLTIMTVGMTSVFVPQDLAFMGLSASDLQAVNPRLVPLIAHDRAGFGGAVACGGFIIFLCLWCGTPSRSLWQALAIAGASGFGSAVGVHPAIGYVDALHLAPAVLGAIVFAAGLALTRGHMILSREDPSARRDEGETGRGQ